MEPSLQRNEPSSLPLHDLPAQVLNLILEKVDSPADIARLTLVSKSLRVLIQNAALRLKLCRKPGIVGPSEVETAKCKRMLVSLTTQFPFIESLDLSSTNVSNNDVLLALQKLKRIKHLSLSNCTKVTVDLPSMLYQAYQPYRCLARSLESINLSRCFQLTESSIFHVLQWSLTPQYRLRSAVFGKMTMHRMNNSKEIAQFFQRVEKMRQETAASIPPTLENGTAFHWSPLKILVLNNTEGVGLCVLDAIVKCCPNLAVFGLGGSTVQIPDALEMSSLFGAAFASVASHLGLSLSSSMSNTEFCPAWIAALVASLSNLWLLELTFFPRREIDLAQRLLSDRIASMTPLQERHLCMIDFNNADSVEFYRSQIAEPFQAFLERGSRPNSASSDLSRFEDLPVSFLDSLVTTASSTSRGGSMLAPNSVYTFNQTPLHCAAEQGNDVHIQALIKSGVILEMRGRGGGSPLLKASREGHVDAVLLLLEAQVDPLTANRHDETSLYIAALRGHTRVVDVIVSFCEFHGIDWKQSEIYKDGWTPLMAAAVADRCDVAKCLLAAAGPSASALTRMKNRYLQTALHIAAYRGCAEMIALLVESGGTQLMSEIDSYGRSAMTFAQHHIDTTSLLMENRPNRRRAMIPRVDFRARWHRWIVERDCPLDYLHSVADQTL